MKSPEQIAQDQAILNAFGQETSTQVPDLNQQGFEWLRDDPNPTEAWKAYRTNSQAWGQNAFAPITVTTRAPDGTFGDPGVTQAQANDANYYNQVLVAINEVRRISNKIREEGRPLDADALDRTVSGLVKT